MHLLRLGARPGRLFSQQATTSHVLVVHARNDHYVPIDFAEAAAERNPDWDLRVLETGGHYPHLDAPAAWLDEVLPWLSCESPRDADGAA